MSLNNRGRDGIFQEESTVTTLDDITDALQIDCVPLNERGRSSSILTKFPDQSRSYKKWSKEEKLAMMEFVEEHGIPSVNVNKFWEECGHYIFQTLGLVKTGASCRSQYARMKCVFSSKCLANDKCTKVSDMSSSSTKKEVSTQYDCIYTCTVSTQTDPPLPVLDIR